MSQDLNEELKNLTDLFKQQHHKIEILEAELTQIRQQLELTNHILHLSKNRRSLRAKMFDALRSILKKSPRIYKIIRTIRTTNAIKKANRQ